MRYLLTAVLLMAHCGGAWAKPLLYVENSDSGHITVIAIPEHEVVATFYAGPHPDDVAASPDGRTLYVNNQFYESTDPGARGVNEVIAFDTVTAEVRWRTELPGVPHHMSVSADGHWLYVPLFDGNFTAVIDTREKRVVRRIFGVVGGHGTRLSPDDARFSVGSMVTDALYAVDVESGEPVKVVNFEDGVRPFTFTRDERTAYVQLSRLHGFEVVDLEAGRIVRRVELPELPDRKSVV